MRETEVPEDFARMYDSEGVLPLLEDEPIEISIDEALREEIESGARRRRLKNVSIKLDPAQIVALKRIATQRAMPYQTLIRTWLADGIRRELERR